MVRFRASETNLCGCGGEATLWRGFPPVRDSPRAAAAPRTATTAVPDSSPANLHRAGRPSGRRSGWRRSLAEGVFWAQDAVMAIAPDYYAVLGVSPDADEAVVRAAWKALLRKFHPDTARDMPDAAERTRAVNAAWAVLGDANRRIAYDLERAAPPEEALPEWISRYPMPPRRSAGTNFALILAFVGLPAVAITLPGVPGQVAAMLPGGDGGSAAGFARSSLNQVRRLLTPAGFGAGSAAASPAAPVAAIAIPPVERATVRLAVMQYGRVLRRHGRGGLAVYSQACAQRAAALARWESEDFCAAFDIAAGRDTAGSASRYARLGAHPAAAADRIAHIRTLLD
jgi:curved DNA-binding protein CbpA